MNEVSTNSRLDNSKCPYIEHFKAYARSLLMEEGSNDVSLSFAEIPNSQGIVPNGTTVGLMLRKLARYALDIELMTLSGSATHEPIDAQSLHNKVVAANDIAKEIAITTLGEMIAVIQEPHRSKIFGDFANSVFLTELRKVLGEDRVDEIVKYVRTSVTTLNSGALASPAPA